MFTGFATGVFEEVLELNTIYQGDVLEQLQSFPDECIQCVVTSPPFWNLRDYGVDGQIGLEETPEEYVDTMVSVFQEVKRVLRKRRNGMAEFGRFLFCWENDSSHGCSTKWKRYVGNKWNHTHL